MVQRDERLQCVVLKVLNVVFHNFGIFCCPIWIFLDSSMVEHSAVNRVVVGSSPTRGVSCFQEKRKYDRLDVRETDKCSCVEQKYGPLVKRLRHRPFTAVTRVRFP